MLFKKLQDQEQEEVKNQTATLGPSIRVNGEIFGAEDIIIQGKIEGVITMGDYRLVISKGGDVSATIYAGTIDIEGQTKGEINGTDQVIVRPTGKVEGTIKAPRVILEDGCRFKGTIEMDVVDFKLLSSSGKVKEIKPHGSINTDQDDIQSHG